VEIVMPLVIMPSGLGARKRLLLKRVALSIVVVAMAVALEEKVGIVVAVTPVLVVNVRRK